MMTDSAAISAWLTASHPKSEVKLVRAGVVLRWGTTREGSVLRFSFFCFSLFFSLLSPFPCSNVRASCHPGVRVPCLHPPARH